MTTGPTVDAALEMALDELSVSRDDVQFEVIVEPRPSIFGLWRKQAQIRTRVRPIVPPPKRDRRRPERTSKSKKPRSSGRKAKVKASGSLKKSTTSSSDKRRSSNAQKKRKGTGTKPDMSDNLRANNDPVPTANRRKRTINPAKTTESTNLSNVRSTKRSRDDEDQLKAPTIRRIRKIDH